MMFRNILALEKTPLLFSLCLHGAFFSFAYYGFERPHDKYFQTIAKQTEVNVIPLVSIQRETQVTNTSYPTKEQKKNTTSRTLPNTSTKLHENAPQHLLRMKLKSQELVSKRAPLQKAQKPRITQPVSAEYTLGSPHNPLPEYPLEALKNGYEGTTHIRVRIDEKGRPLAFKLEKSSGHSCLDTAAHKALKSWIFQPAHRENKKIESELTVPIKFVLDDPD